MSAENKALARRVFEEVWNEGNLDAIDEIYARDVEEHPHQPGFPPGMAGTKAFISMYMSAFPDTKMTVDLQIAEGDKVATRWTAQGTHKGELMGIPATGKQVTVTGVGIDRIAGGQIVETWGEFDQMGMMQQLGVVPVPGE